MIKSANKLGVSATTIKSWIRIYKTFGYQGLITSKTNKFYDDKTKLKAVEDYLNGIGSFSQICIKYHISSCSVLEDWIRLYNNGHKIFSHNNKGDRTMTKGRKTTYEERVEIVSFCIANANDYKLTAKKYKVSYQQIYTWVKKYDKNGYNALVDRRGKNKPFEKLNESQKVSAQLKLLQAENKRLKMENDFVKKLEEIERR